MRSQVISIVAVLLLVGVAAQASVSTSYDLSTGPVATLSGSQSLSGLTLTNAGTLTINGSSSPVLTIGSTLTVGTSGQLNQTLNLSGNVNFSINQGDYPDYWSPSFQIWQGATLSGSGTLTAPGGGLIGNEGTITGTHTLNAAYIMNDWFGKMTGTINLNIDASNGFLDEGFYIGEPLNNIGSYWGANAQPAAMFNSTGGTINGNVYLSVGQFLGAEAINGQVWVCSGTFRGNHTITGSLNVRTDYTNAPNNDLNSYVSVNWGCTDGWGTVGAALVGPGNVGVAGTMTVNGPVTLDSNTTLIFQLGSTSDRLNATGAVNLGQDTHTPLTLNISSLSGFYIAPTNSASYTLMTGSSLTGTVTLGNAYGAGKLYSYTPTYTGTSLGLNVTRLAGSSIWVGGTGTDFSTAANWDNGLPTSGTNVGMDSLSGSPTVTMSAPASIASLSIGGSGAWTINGASPLTVGAGGLTYDNCGAGSTISAPLSGPVTVLQGSLGITGPMSGNIAVSGGALTVSGAVSGASNYAVSGGTLTVNGSSAGTGNVSVTGTGTMFLNSPLSGSASVLVNTAYPGQMTMTGPQSYTGTTTVNGGTLTVTGDLGAGNVLVTAGYLTLTGANISAGAPGSEIHTTGGTLNGTGTINRPVEISATSSYTYFSPGAGGITINTPGQTGMIFDGTGTTYFGNLTVNGDVLLSNPVNVSYNQNFTVNGNLVYGPGGSLAFQGGSTVFTVTGSTTLAGGRINGSSSSNFPQITYSLTDPTPTITNTSTIITAAIDSNGGTIFNNSTSYSALVRSTPTWDPTHAHFDIDTNSYYKGAITFNAPVNLNSGTTTIAGTNNSNYGGRPGVQSLATGAKVNGTGVWTIASGATLSGTGEMDSLITGTGAISVYPGVVRGGWDYGAYQYSNTLVIANPANTFSGAINVYGGKLEYGFGYDVNGNPTQTDRNSNYAPVTNSCLGTPSSINLGMQGSLGMLTNNVHPSLLTPNMSVNGEGGIIQSAWGWTLITGSISGSGQLILSGDRTYLWGASGSTYSGGTRVWCSYDAAGVGTPSFDGNGNWGVNEWAVGTTADVLGTGNVRVEYGGCIRVAVASNMGPTAQVSVVDSLPGSKVTTNSVFSVKSDFVPTFTADSSGTLGIDCTSGPIINARLAAGQPQLGNGYMSYGIRDGGTFSGASLLADLDNVYRFGGMNELALSNSVLNDNTATPYGVTLFPGYVYVRSYGENNTFSGTLTVNGSAEYRQWKGTTDAAKTPMGSASGNIVMNGVGIVQGRGELASLWLINSAGASQLPYVKHDISFTGENDVWVDCYNVGPTTLQLTSLTRVDKGMISIDGVRGNLGAASGTGVLSPERVTVATRGADLTPVNGMVSPIYTTYNGGSNFLTYDATLGFQPVTYTATTLAGAGSTSLVNLTAGDTVASGGKTVYALKTNSGIGGTGTLTVTSGGLIVAPAAATTISCPLTFTSEPLIYIRDQDVHLSGVITSSNGLTLGGGGTRTLYVDGDNHTTLDGTITVNEGIYQPLTLNSIGKPSVVIALNGGRFRPGFSGDVNHPVYLGAAGGTVGCFGNYVNLNQQISGPGALVVEGWSNVWIHANNTYTGGTDIEGGCSIDGAGNLGTGPIKIGSGGITTFQNAGISPTQRVSMVSTSGQFSDCAAALSVGSIEGIGTIYLGAQSWQTTNAIVTLTTGSDNSSTEFMGNLMNHSDPAPSGVDRPTSIGGIIKTGTGTWTLGGYNTYSGTTVLNNGGLVMNGTLAPTLPATTSAGTITGGVTVGNASGNAASLSGTGVIDRDVTILATGTMNGGLAITGNVTSVGAINAAGVITGNLTANAGTVAGTTAVTGNFTVGVIGSTTATVTGQHVIGGNLAVNRGTFTADAGTTVGSLNVSSTGTFSGSGAIVGAVANAGTIAGTHTFGGNYTQTAGSFSGTSTFGTTGSPVAVAINAGTFAGNNTVHGTFTTAAGSHAGITPHLSGGAGTLTVDGNVTLDTTTALNFDLATPGTTGSGINDLIDITGNLSLDGTLNVTNLSGFGAGTYRLFNYTGTLSGAGTLTQGTMPTGFTYTIDTSITGQVNLGVVPPWILGDTDHSGGSTLNTLDIDAIYAHFGAASTSQWKVYPDTNPVGQEDVTYEVSHYMLTNYADANLDRYTDFTDFQVLLDHWQAPGGWADGDFNGDGTVDFLDFQVLLDYWNPTGWSAGASQVPEPASLSLLLLGGLALLRRNRRA